MARCPTCSQPKRKCWCPKFLRALLKGNCSICGRELPCFDH